MPEQENLRKKFIYLFTQEIILHLKEKQNYLENERLEEERRKKSIEVEKLKNKFSRYEAKPTKNLNEKIPVEKHKPEISTFITRPLLPEKILQEEKSIPQTAFKKPEQITFSKVQPPVLQKLPPAKPVLPGEIDFGKINALIQDRLVTSIECQGENKNLIVKRAGTIMRTQITLNKDEIMKIIQSFSDEAKIPLIEGMLNARVKDFEIAAVVSENLGPSFILKRILIDIISTIPTKLEKPMMQFSGQNPKDKPIMPPITRPFTSTNPPKPLSIEEKQKIVQSNIKPPIAPIKTENPESSKEEKEKQEDFLSKPLD
jgi:hypothetical protein